MMKRTDRILSLILALILLIGAGCTVSAGAISVPSASIGVGDGVSGEEQDPAAPFAYAHDPQANPYAMKDIVRDESAVYGFRPGATGSLKQYADMAWDDPVIVAQGRAERIAYHKSIGTMYEALAQMENDGKSAEEIARAMSKMRNDLRIASYKDDPEGLEQMKQRNREKYGHEEGPLPDELYAQYGSSERCVR